MTLTEALELHIQGVTGEIQHGGSPYTADEWTAIWRVLENTRILGRMADYHPSELANDAHNYARRGEFRRRNRA